MKRETSSASAREEKKLLLAASDVQAAYSWAVAFAIEALPNRCYRNAWNALIQLPDLFVQGHYVEGWVVFEETNRVVVVEQSWCTLPDGLIVDPSLILLLSPGQCVHYFAGMALNRKQTRALEGASLPHVCYDGQYGADGMGHAAYKAAYQAALHAASCKAALSSPPKEISLQKAAFLSGEEDLKHRGDSGLLRTDVI